MDTPDGTEAAPVFVDLSGRRRRLGRRVGMVCGGLLAAFLVAMGIGVATGASVPGTPWKAVPGTQHHHKKAKSPAPQPKQIPRGQNRPDGRPATTGPSEPSGTTGGGGGGGHSSSPGGTTAPSTSPKPSTSSAPSPTATPTASPTRTRPGNGKPTPPGQTRRPRAAG